MGDVPEYQTTIWVAVGYIMKKLIYHESVLEKLDVVALMKEFAVAREGNFLTASIKTYVDNAMAQATSETSHVVTGYRIVYGTRVLYG